MKNVYGLIGEHLSHSFSPQIHQEILGRLGLEGDYRLFELAEGELETSLSTYRQQGVKGLNVTVPYKIKIMRYLDSVSPEAERIGAVNTIAPVNGVWRGYNTDYQGFGMSLSRNGIDVEGRSIVILGTGGVSKAVAQYLTDKGADSIVFVSRRPGGKAIGYEELSGRKGYMIINCTPCGMYPEMQVSPVSPDILEGFCTAVDLIYNPEETLFLKLAGERGLKRINGLYMLVGQAVAAQQIWNNTRLTEAQVDDIYNSVKEILYGQCGSKCDE